MGPLGRVFEQWSAVNLSVYDKISAFVQQYNIFNTHQTRAENLAKRGRNLEEYDNHLEDAKQVTKSYDAWNVDSANQYCQDELKRNTRKAHNVLPTTIPAKPGL